MKQPNPFRDSLSTKRLRLHLYTGSPEDEKCILACLNNPVAYASMGDMGVHNEAELNDLFRNTRMRVSTFSSLQSERASLDLVELIEQDCYYILSLKEDRDGVVLGGVSIGQRPGDVPPDIGWAILPEHQGKGYATEAAAELLRYACQELKIKSIIAWPNSDNKNSVAVAAKIGMVECGKIKDKDTGAEHVVYGTPGFKMEGISELSIR